MLIWIVEVYIFVIRGQDEEEKLYLVTVFLHFFNTGDVIIISVELGTTGLFVRLFGVDVGFDFVFDDNPTFFRPYHYVNTAAGGQFRIRD